LGFEFTAKNSKPAASGFSNHIHGELMYFFFCEHKKTSE